MESPLLGVLQQVQQQEPAQKAVCARQQHHLRLGRQLRGRRRGSGARHVSLGQEALQPQVRGADRLRVAAVDAGERRAGRLPTTVRSTGHKLLTGAAPNLPHLGGVACMLR